MKNRFSRLVRFMSDVMTGVPSIVMGLFIYVMWTLRFGYSAFGGSLALACLMLPVVIGSTEQMLKLVPAHLREASYALGTTKSRTILTVVLPAALPGIVSGSLLAVARAAGETAPLLFAVGAATEYNPHLFDEANTALSLQIFGNATSSFVAAQDRAWGAALTLVLLTFLITLDRARRSPRASPAGGRRRCAPEDSTCETRPDAPPRGPIARRADAAGPIGPRRAAAVDRRAGRLRSRQARGLLRRVPRRPRRHA